MPGTEINVDPAPTIVDEGSHLFEVFWIVQIYCGRGHHHETGISPQGNECLGALDVPVQMRDAEGLAFHVNGAHPEPIVDNLHLHFVHPNHLTKRAVGVGGEDLGFDLQDFRHDNVSFRRLWQIVLENGSCIATRLTVARQLAIALPIAEHNHLAGS